MRIATIVVLVLLTLNVLLGWYAIHQIRHRCHSRLLRYLAIVLLALMGVALIGALAVSSAEHLTSKMWLIQTYISLLFPLLVALLFDLAASAPTLWHRPRWHWLTITGIVAAGALCAAMWWGALVTSRSLDVKRVTLHVPDLPPAFRGMTIAQISDLHLGSFGSDTTFVSRLVAETDSLRPDLIVFTGDMVCNQSSEMAPFLSTLRRLKAPLGVYAILGNHDYGDYISWPSPRAKAHNLQQLHDLYRQTGIRLLRDQTAWLHRGSDSLALIGVENIGEGRFKIYGSLKHAYPDISDHNAKILLTHNPHHWTDSIAPDPRANICLTLCGHTHAMQMQIGPWSPSQWRYPTWEGLYAASGRYMYVNTGAGTVGFPMRLGVAPEITFITLR